MRRIIGVIAVVVALGLLAVFLVLSERAHIEQRASRAARMTSLEQLGQALLMYSEASDGHLFPPKSVEHGVFMPDLDVLAELVPDVRHNDSIAALYAGHSERPICYLGHIIATDEQAALLMGEYETRPPDEVRHGDVTADAEKPWRPSKNILRLRQYAERFYLGDVRLGATERMRGRIPVLWEIPRNRRDKFFVFYLDGNIKLVKYPLPSLPYWPDPMWTLSTQSINIVRETMSLPTDPIPSIVPPENPVAAPVLAVFRASMEDYTHERAPLTLESYDDKPTVFVEGRGGYRVSVSSAELALFPEGQNHMRVSAEVVFAGRYAPSGTVIALHMGSGMGFSWYGILEYEFAEILRRELELVGGDDPYDVLLTMWDNRPSLPELVDPFADLPAEQRLARLKEAQEKAETASSYATAYMLLREAQGNPISQELINACSVWCTSFRDRPGPVYSAVRRAKDVMCADSEAAVVALLLMLNGCKTQQQAGIIMRLPEEVKEPLVERLGYRPEWPLPPQ